MATHKYAPKASNIYWVITTQSYKVSIRRNRKHITRSFAVNVYGSKEQALAAAIVYRDKVYTEYPLRRSHNTSGGNEAWQALSNHPRKRPASQLLEWFNK
jgi:hypothetical protein